MGREGWIYAIAFVAIAGVGAMIILPRLDRKPDADDVPGDASSYRFEPEPDEPPREAGPEVEAFEGNPEYAWIDVKVQGVGAKMVDTIEACLKTQNMQLAT